MVVLNPGTDQEVTLRLVLESDVHGREVFDHYANIAELMAGHRRLVQRAAQQTAADGIERLVAVAIVPVNAYGFEDRSGDGLKTGTPARPA